MFNSGFPNLAGVLCSGYYMHQFSIPIIKQAREPEKNQRNVGIGYFFVFLTYTFVGMAGYFAFSGSKFQKVYENQQTDKGIISQNFLSMFSLEDIPAVVVRLLIYIQLSCSYPLIAHFVKVIIMNFMWQTTEVSDFTFRILSAIITTTPLCFCLFYPRVGNVLGYAASLSGFLMIYVVPVVAYFKMKKVEIMNPLLAGALQENEVELFVPQAQQRQLPKNIEEEKAQTEQLLIGKSQHLMTTSPKIVISDRFLKRNNKIPKSPSKKTESSDVINISDRGSHESSMNPVASTNYGSNTERTQHEIKLEKMRQWKISYALHMLIPAYGLLIVLLVFFPNLLG